MATKIAKVFDIQDYLVNEEKATANCSNSRPMPESREADDEVEKLVLLRGGIMV